MRVFKCLFAVLLAGCQMSMAGSAHSTMGRATKLPQEVEGCPIHFVLDVACSRNHTTGTEDECQLQTLLVQELCKDPGGITDCHVSFSRNALPPKLDLMEVRVSRGSAPMMQLVPVKHYTAEKLRKKVANLIAELKHSTPVVKEVKTKGK